MIIWNVERAYIEKMNKVIHVLSSYDISKWPQPLEWAIDFFFFFFHTDNRV